MIGVLGLVLGSPSTEAEVKPFLGELFSDRDMIKLPAQKLLGPLIARRRLPKALERYQAIGGASPLMAISMRQVTGAAQALTRRGTPARPYLAARYLGPRCREVLEAMQRDGIERAAVLPLYPQQSRVTTGSALADLEAARTEDTPELKLPKPWCTHEGYIAALVATVRDALAALPAAAQESAHLLFAAHSIPLKLVRQRDPYPDEILKTTDAVLREIDWQGAYSNAYQSRVGPIKWLGPDTSAEIARLGSKGVKTVVVVPVSFVSDHLETLYDLDIELKQDAERAGVTQYTRCAALNDRPVFIEALADIAEAALQ